jgi:hypothetical protein
MNIALVITGWVAQAVTADPPNPFNPDGTARPVTPAAPTTPSSAGDARDKAPETGFGPTSIPHGSGGRGFGSCVAARESASNPSPELPLSGFSAFVEQDLLFPPRNMDRNYTMGVGLHFPGHWIHGSYLDRGLHFFDCLTGLDGVHAEFRQGGLSTDQLESHSFIFGVGAFTPDNLHDYAPVTTDRPYSSLTFASFGRSTVDPSRSLVLKTELTLGVLGLPIARGVQTFIHDSLRPDGADPDGEVYAKPRGWPNQISNGGEPTGKYTATLQKGASESRFHDLAFSGEASLGYYTNLAVGGALRIGRLRSKFWTFAPNPMTLANQATGQAARRIDRRELEAFGWAGGAARVVVYNALLQGQLRDTAFSLSGSQIEHFVQEFQTGVTIGVCGWRLTYVVVAGRSPELLIGTPRFHIWGALFLSYSASTIPDQKCF